MKIKILTPEDWQQYKLLRLEALKNAPECFLASYEEEASWPDVNFQNVCAKSTIFVVLMNCSLVSCAGFDCVSTVKANHRGMIWGMYTKPEYRGQGMASALMQAIFNYARPRISHIYLRCAASNLKAVSLYKKIGFTIYSTEPSALKVNDTYIDKYLMMLDLTQPLNNA